MTIIKTQGLSFEYPHVSIAAIKNINIEIEQGEMLAIIGHTGSGKSTLVQHFNAILKPTKGKVFVDGNDILKDRESIKEARFKVGLCFQYPEYQLFGETVYKDIAFGPKNMGLGDDEIDARVRRAAEYIGLKAELLDKSPFDLSGGEKRRAAIAGVMSMEPLVLVLDEPTAGLDPSGRDTILQLIKEYRKNTGKTVILISHNMEEVAKIASKVLVMNEGETVMYGDVDEVYSHGDKLYDMGLNVPAITRVFMGLKERGLPVSNSIYTVEQGKREIMNLLSKGAKN